jgi:hypothetical protein
LLRVIHRTYHSAYFCKGVTDGLEHRSNQSGRGILRGPCPFIWSIWSIGTKEGRPHPLHTLGSRPSAAHISNVGGASQPSLHESDHKPLSLCRNHSFAVYPLALLGTTISVSLSRAPSGSPLPRAARLSSCPCKWSNFPGAGVWRTSPFGDSRKLRGEFIRNSSTLASVAESVMLRG